MLGHGQRSGAWVEDSRTSDSSSSFSTFFFCLPSTLSLTAFGQAKDGFLPIPQWTNSACLQPPVPLQSACWSLHCLPGGAKGRRSGRGWGHSCSSLGLHFLPQPWASGAEEAQAGRPELPPAREAYRALPTTPQPSCPQRLSIFLWY